MTKKRRGLHDQIGCLWIGLVFLSCLRRAFHLEVSTEEWKWFLKIIAYPLSYGPCLYLYTRVLVQNQTKLKKTDLLHFLPFLFFAIGSYFPNLETEKFRIDLGLSSSWYTTLIYGVATPISLIPYCILSFRLVQKHFSRIHEFFSYEEIGITLKWLNTVCITFLLILLVQMFYLIVQNVAEPIYPSPRFTNSLMIGFLLLLSFFILRQQAVFHEEKTELDAVSENEKYSKSRIEKAKMDKIADDLLKYMEQHKPYLKDDLGIQDITEALQISTNHLSQVFNLHLRKNFFTLTNEYRIEEVKTRLKDSEFKEYPVLRIGLECGFNSKSSFYSVFRKMTGLRPGEFKRV
ncbi:helix-turn-helix domain-containing protein [Leptospira sp. WS92.C1]